jgi:2-C-methyl-D-erythritol 4-phosphate cytidylyltransferase
VHELRVAAIVLAAGSGERIAGPTNKVLLPIGGKPMLIWSLELFERLAIVEGVVLVVPDRDRSACETVVRAARLQKVKHIVLGGASRHESEYRGLLAIADDITAGSIDLVLVHDAARPFAQAERVEAVTKAARRTGAAILAIPATEPIVALGPGPAVEDTGEGLWVAQTPQAFSATLVLDAHRRAARDGFRGTDTSSVVERLGEAVAVVPDRPDNIKITTPDDLLRGELIAEQLRAREDDVLLGALWPRI